MAKNFFELSPTYMNRDSKIDRPSILATRAIIVGFLSDDYRLNKDDLPLIQAHLKRNGCPNAEGTIRNIARMYELVYLALNGDDKTVEYLNTIKKSLYWMRSPFDDLRKDGFVNWQSIEVYWQEREKERFCRGCQAKKSLARVLDDCTLCQEQLLRSREQIEDLFKERIGFLAERKLALAVKEEKFKLQAQIAVLLEENAVLKEELKRSEDERSLCQKILELVGSSLQDFISYNRPAVLEEENLTSFVGGKETPFLKVCKMDFPIFSQKWNCRVEYDADFKKGLENPLLSNTNRKKIRRAVLSLSRRGIGGNGKYPIATTFELKKAPAGSFCMEAAGGIFIVFKKEPSRLVFFEIVKK